MDSGIQSSDGFGRRPARGSLWRGGCALLGACCLWANWPILASLVVRWQSDPQHSHGFLIPLIAAYIGWSRANAWDKQRTDTGRPGIAILALLVALGAQLVGGYFYLEPLEHFSVVLQVGAIVLLVGGSAALRSGWPAVAFLLFMIPWPYQFEQAVRYPLQSWATGASTFLLQLFGFGAVQAGNLIHLDGLTVGVAEACSGLRMLNTLLAIAVAAAVLLDRTALERSVLLLTAPLVAVAVNVLRITATSVVYVEWGPEVGEAVAHDVAGWLMMPVAGLLLWWQIRLLDLIAPVATKTEPHVQDRPSATGHTSTGTASLTSLQETLR